MIIDPYTWQNLPITTISPLTADVVSVCVPRPAGYSFKAGQYVVMKVTVEGLPLMRQYSIASAPQSTQLEFLVQREVSGAVSNWFHDVAETEMEIAISQPFGHFVIENKQQPNILIAGRVGIAPFLSMIRESLEEAGSTNDVLLYSARGINDFCYKELLDQSDANLFNSLYGERITPDVLQTSVESTRHYYLCGSKRFVDSIAAELLRLNVPADHIKRELFTLQ